MKNNTKLRKRNYNRKYQHNHRERQRVYEEKSHAKHFILHYASKRDMIQVQSWIVDRAMILEARKRGQKHGIIHHA